MHHFTILRLSRLEADSFCSFIHIQLSYKYLDICILLSSAQILYVGILGPNRHISPAQILHELGPKGQISQAQMLHGLGPKGHISPATILHELGPKVLDALTFELVNYVGVEGEYNPPHGGRPIQRVLRVAPNHTESNHS